MRELLTNDASFDVLMRYRGVTSLWRLTLSLPTKYHYAYAITFIPMILDWNTSYYACIMCVCNEGHHLFLPKLFNVPHLIFSRIRLNSIIVSVSFFFTVSHFSQRQNDRIVCVCVCIVRKFPIKSVHVFRKSHRRHTEDTDSGYFLIP